MRHGIKHVFVMVLENEGYDSTFGPSFKARDLSQAGFPTNKDRLCLVTVADIR